MAIEELATTLALRPVVESDRKFLFEVYASTRWEELSVVDWSREQKLQFLQMQFRAQDTFYRENYARAEYSIILQSDRAVGRLYVDRRPHEIRILDIALVPGDRNRGIGSYYLQALAEESDRRQVPLNIHVERNNPALRLYHRLGFRTLEDKGVYLFLERSPQSSI